MARPDDDPNRIINRAAAEKQARRDREHADYLKARDRAFSGGSGRTGGGGGATCFPYGTLIRTPHGLIDIAKLSTGDVVIGVDPLTQEQKPRKILRVVPPHPSRVLTIDFIDGTSVRTTMRHSFLLEGKWKKACKIRAGHSMTFISGTSVGQKRVLGKRLGDAMEPVVNLIVEGDFTFIADDVIAHSFTYFRRTLGLLWSISEKMTYVPLGRQQRV
jgi:hypothetical protein